MKPDCAVCADHEKETLLQDFDDIQEGLAPALLDNLRLMSGTE